MERTLRRAAVTSSDHGPIHPGGPPLDSRRSLGPRLRSARRRPDLTRDAAVFGLGGCDRCRTDSSA
jgi:hypothetical protein